MSYVTSTGPCSGVHALVPFCVISNLEKHVSLPPLSPMVPFKAAVNFRTGSRSNVRGQVAIEVDGQAIAVRYVVDM